MHILGHTNGSIQLLAAALQDWPGRLRWGGPQVSNAINGEAHLLDGLEQLRAFQAANVPCPPFVTADIPNDGGVWLARKRNHTQGKDIVVVGQRSRGRRNWRDSDFFTKYLASTREWRFHIYKGQSIARGCKQGPTIVDTPQVLIRSRRLGWTIRHDVDPPKGLRKLAKAAVEAVGYDLGAVDMLELADGTGVVLEVNSRPAIRDDYTIGQYCKAFRSF